VVCSPQINAVTSKNVAGGRRDEIKNLQICLVQGATSQIYNRHVPAYDRLQVAPATAGATFQRNGRRRPSRTTRVSIGWLPRG